jgi:hypothetical protein
VAWIFIIVERRQETEVIMKEEMLKQLVERTFNKIACPLEGNGVYAELEEAIKMAYDLGKNKQDTSPVFMPVMNNSKVA